MIGRDLLSKLCLLFAMISLCLVVDYSFTALLHQVFFIHFIRRRGPSRFHQKNPILHRSFRISLSRFSQKGSWPTSPFGCSPCGIGAMRLTPPHPLIPSPPHTIIRIRKPSIEKEKNINFMLLDFSMLIRYHIQGET